MKVVIAASNASLSFGGEALIPINYFRILKKRGIDVWLVTHARNKKDLELSFPGEELNIHYVPNSLPFVLINELSKRLPAKISTFTSGLLILLLTEYYQKKIIKKMICEHGIDLVHRPIPVSPTIPSLFFNLGVPVVIGPMNGGMEYPPAFKNYESILERVFTEIAKKFLVNFVNVVFPGKIKAEILLVSNERTRLALPKKTKGKIIELVENAVDLSIMCHSGTVIKDKNQIKFVCIARFVKYKSIDLLIEAYKPVAMKYNASLEIIGDGFLRKSLEELCAKLDLTENVKFSGWLSQQECARRMENSDVFVLPSLNDCGGAVVLEAMAMKLPIIATKWGGFIDYVDQSNGILIEPNSREFLVEELTRAMLKLAENVELREQLGQCGYEKILKKFNWENKIDSIIEIYKEAI